MALTCGGSGGSGGSGFPPGGGDGGPVGGADLVFGRLVGFAVVVAAVRDELDRAILGRVEPPVEAGADGVAVVEVGGDGIGERERAHATCSGRQSRLSNRVP
jgi:hypothetical protein